MFDTLSFLSDLGHGDESVGVVKSVIRSLAPHVTIVDVTHEVPPHDVRAGGLSLARAAQYLCPGVVLAVVDPAAGSGRLVAVEVGGGQSFLVGPDNGVLAPAVSMVGGADRAVALARDAVWQIPAPAPTFAGRDVLAPAAALLCTGVELVELGELVDPSTLLPGVLPVSRLEGDRLVCEVLFVDRYGAAQLNVDPDELDGWGDRVRIEWAGDARTARRASLAALGRGELGLVVDAHGLVALALSRSSAAGTFGFTVGDEVHLVRFDGDEPPGATTPVELRARG